jgi:hypothetical protein
MKGTTKLLEQGDEISLINFFKKVKLLAFRARIQSYGNQS